MHTIEAYRSFFLDRIKQETLNREPDNLYAPIRYIMNLGGKRLRPVLTLLTAEIFGASYKDALSAAIAIEVFHNFSLVHDDIMDAAPVRRGQPTVHEKWNTTTAILSGDAMLILAYQYFEDYEPKVFLALAKLFSRTALQVCEGQQWDIDFENSEKVLLKDYLKMIEYKTAVLVAAAMEMGAIIANASKEDCAAIYNFGLNLGIAFQIQDDYLDAFGNPENFGKQIGGDIIENKKTYLYLKALEFGSKSETVELKKYFTAQNHGNQEKVEAVKMLFLSSGAAKEALKGIEEYTQKAFEILKSINIDADKKNILHQFGKNLMKRTV
ncbi:polyprenyl synthetase family protein [Flavobacterium ardleyense]|uniref:polyprenyl synthetase family protein n=1 Tax=Flavobacterium ardleyense TaxID=2038737 RepID=UPI00298C0A5E|nr:polyprenyl synthetase family protein [Flavobacterium ardleyense]